MKRIVKSLFLFAALMSTMIAATGCGNSNPAPGPGGPGGIPGVPGIPAIPNIGGVQRLPDGSAKILFSGSGVYNSGVRIYGATPNFATNGIPATLALQAGVDPTNQPGTIVGTFYYFPDSSIQLQPTNTPPGVPGVPTAGYPYPYSPTPYGGYPTTGYYPGGYPTGVTPTGTSNLNGAVILSPRTVQALFGGAIPTIVGLKLDVNVAGTQTAGGTVWFCTNVDQMGCHGVYQPLN